MLRNPQEIFSFITNRVPDEIKDLLQKNTVYYMQREDSGEVYRTVYKNGELHEKRKFVVNYNFKIEKFSIVVFENKGCTSWFIAILKDKVIHLVEDREIKSSRESTKEWIDINSILGDLSEKIVSEIDIDSDRMADVIKRIKNILENDGKNIDVRFGELDNGEIPEYVKDALDDGKAIPVTFEDLELSPEDLAKKLIDYINSKSIFNFTPANTIELLKVILSEESYSKVKPITIFIEDTLHMNVDKILVHAMIFKNEKMKIRDIKLDGDFIIPKNASIIQVNTPDSSPMLIVYNGEECTVYSNGIKLRTWEPPVGVVTISDLVDYLKYEMAKDLYRNRTTNKKQCLESITSGKVTGRFSVEKLEDVEQKDSGNDVAEFFKNIDDKFSDDPYSDILDTDSSEKNNKIDKKEPTSGQDPKSTFIPPFKWDDSF